MKKMNKMVKKHLKGDIKTFKKEAAEDRELISKLTKHPSKKKKKEKEESPKHEKKEKKEDKKDPKGPKKYTKIKETAQAKRFISKRMNTFKQGEMHSRVKGTGPVVTNPKQAIAIALSEERKKQSKRKKK